MIVTCDHCGARYKLDESKISGRGAKITCPRCRHVFVVYRETADAAAAGGSAEATPPPGALSAPAPQPDLDVHKLDFRKVGIQSWKVKVKIGLVYDFSDYKTLAKYITDGRVTSTDLLSHNGQDWRPIGDIPDLKGHFVQVYRDAEAAMNAPPPKEESARGVERFEDDGPTNIMGMEDLAGTLGAERATQAAGAASPQSIGSSSAGFVASLANDPTVEELFKTGLAAEEAPPRFVDPFEQRKKARQKKPKAGGAAGGPAPKPAPDQPTPRSSRPVAPPVTTEVKSGGGRAGLMAALLLLVVGGGVAFWWMQQQAEQISTTAVGPKAAPVPPKAAPGTDQPGGIVPENIGTEVPPDEADPWEEPEEEKLCPIGPNGKPICDDGAVPVMMNANAGRRPSGGSMQTPPAAPGIAVTKMSAKDYATEGQAAFRRGDYSHAAASFKLAVNEEPGNIAYKGLLGASLFRAGDTAGAMSYLQQAASGGYAPAYDYLGDLSAQQGDVPGAIGHYQSYLASSPKDAANVRQKIDKLSGGG